ncbi:actin filament-associated protein 1 isoform X2 [Seriola lalandi dorsalis]|uniref:Actin filament-associated protein 1 n=1 Tax=Seriola lalandi dorsalis TaxID=1841481 RepID=A0A3B4XL79_SERLL|nr:actin filament-associated protein 1 isoform X2 [Seriola lalandi dorsalis]XP_056225204.1 actin filament-associated protein 1 isoform X2 [Seriola aureovittata]
MRSDPVLFTTSRAAMEELVCELRLFLDLLDREYLSAGVREKKMHLSNILHRVLSDKEPSFKSEIHSGLPAPPQMPLPEIPHPWLPANNGPPPLPSSSLPEGYYEEAVPLSPGKAPEYITSNYDSDAMSSSYESYDEEEEDGKGQKMHHQWPSEEASMDLVKDARICAFLLRKKRFGQWTKLLCVIKDNKLLCYKSSKDHTPQMELTLSGCSITHIPKDGKKKKHELKIVHQGADALVLAVQSKEQAEEWLKVMREVCVNGSVDLDGAGAGAGSGSPVHKPELEKKASCDRPSSDGEAAHENGHSDCKEQGKGKKNSKSEHKTGTVGKGAGKKITKIIGLGKKKPSTDEQTSSAEEDVPTCGYLNVLSNNRWRERWCRLKDNQLLLHKDRDDLKSHIASLPLRGCEVSPGLDHKHPFAFRLLRNSQEVAVLEASSSEEMGRWLGVLLAETGSTTDPATLHYDYIDVETTANVIQLAKQSFCFTSKRAVSPNPYLDNPVNGYACPTGMALHYDDVPINGTELLVLYSSPSPAGCKKKEEGHYENTELYENMPSPKLATRYPPKSSSTSSSSTSTSHYKTPVSKKISSKFLSTDTKTKDTAQLKGKKGTVTNGMTSKQKAEPKNQSKKNGVHGTASLKRNNSNAEQCKYGKNRVEADAKRLQTKEEELMKKKQEIRNHLTQLKNQRRDMRTAVEAAAGKRSHGSLSERLKKVEEDCRQKEEERVNLELELTEVKESLKKALSGGVTLGLTIEPKAGSSGLQSPSMLRRTQESSPFSSCDTSDTESCSLPVNSASLLRRQQGGQKASPVRGHVLRKAKEWEQKNGT